MSTVAREGSYLYDAVAYGLGTYARTAFRVRVLGATPALDPHGIWVSSHRSDADVPLIILAVYKPMHGRLHRGRRLHFAVRDDLFVPGFFAGYPPGLPRAARRLLFPIGIGGIMRRKLPCHPIRSATRMRLAELLREHPDAPLDEVLPPPLTAPLLERAAALRESPRLARDVLNGGYADLLWRVTGPAELGEISVDGSWRRRAAAAMSDFRELVQLVRDGGTLLIFPEGRPSPDGELGPIQGGVAALVRRARPATVRPFAPAYDPLVEGRTLALLAVGEPGPPPADESGVLALLRATTPLTVGSSVAAALADGDDPHARLAADVEAARAEGRLYEPELDDAAARRARVETALRLAPRADLDRLAREYRSARA